MSNANALIRALAQQRGLDPAAVLAVASAEGLSGGIGDSGHAFGPWQLNNAGGVITGRFSGQSPQAINAWAWSPQGIKFALDRIVPVARGLHGNQAIASIVNRFERPAAPGPEIQRAAAAYRKFQGNNPGGVFAGGAPGPGGNPALGAGSSAYSRVGSSLPPLPSTPQPLSYTSPGGIANTPNVSRRLNLLNAIVGGLTAGKDIDQILPGALASFQSAPVQRGGFRPQPMPFRPSPSTPVAPSGLPAGTVTPLPYRPGDSPRITNFAELLNEGTGGSTHSTGPHIHFASTDPQSMLSAIRYAQSLGLRVGENPYTDTVDPVHATNSYHYRRFPGLYHGKPLGEAIDVTGAKAQQFYQTLSSLRNRL